MKRTERPRVGDGFTLLELAVVLVLLALLAGVATMRLALPYRQARLGDVVQRIRVMDEQVRFRAARCDQAVWLVCDFDSNAICAEVSGDERVAHLRCVLPRAIALGRVRLVGRIHDGGRMTIPVAADGQTASYAVRLDVGQRPGPWLFFAGISGQMTVLESETDVDELFAFPEGRADAD